MAAVAAAPRERQRALDLSLGAAGVGLVAVGVFGGATALALLGVLLVATMVLILAPELMVCALVVAGSVKAAPWFPELPVDLTLVAWAGTILAMLVRGLRPGIGIPPFPRAMALALPLVAIVVASAFWSLDREGGAAKALQFELVTMTAFVAPVVLIRSRAALVRLAYAFCGYGLLIALTTVETENLGEPLAAAGGNQIQAALYPAIAVVFICTYLALLARGVSRLAVLAPLAILLPATFAAGSRGVFIGAVVVSGYIAGRAVLVSARRGRVLLAVGLATVGAVVLWPYLAGGAEDRYQQQLLSTNLERVVGERENLYRRGVYLAADNPIVGVGAGGFAYSSIVYERAEYPHNILLEFASEEGLAAAALFAALVIAAWRARLRSGLGANGPEVLLSGALLLLFLSEAMVSFDINGNRGMWFALGLAFALRGLRPDAVER